jgi:hypothetical protein
VIYRRKRTGDLKSASKRLAMYLSILVCGALITLYSLDYFPDGAWDFHQSPLAFGVKAYVSSKVSPKKHEAIKAVQAIFEQRTKLLLGGDTEETKDNYDLSSTTGEWAYEKVKKRTDYLRKWVLARGVCMVEAASTFEIDSVFEESDGSFWIELTEHTVYAYEYSPADLFQPAWIYGKEEKPLVFNLAANSTPIAAVLSAFCREDVGITGQQAGPVNNKGLCGWEKELQGQFQGAPSICHRFGSRTVHVIEIICLDGKWKIRKDWCLDPLGDDVGEPARAASMSLNHGISDILETGILDDSHMITGTPWLPVSATVPVSGILEAADTLAGLDRPIFDRDKALAYAEKHSGVRALPNGGKYNSKYKVYTFAGGDCANFASQVLHAAGIPQGHGWHYTKEGSTAWVQSESLVWYLLSSGRGCRTFRGQFAEAVSTNQARQAEKGKQAAEPLPESLKKPSAESPVDQLEPGDIIAYETKGEICHVAVVAGKDPRGYVTIASHTSDRLYFPWDLGWSHNTLFWFIKISY